MAVQAVSEEVGQTVENRARLMPGQLLWPASANHRSYKSTLSLPHSCYRTDGAYRITSFCRWIRELPKGAGCNFCLQTRSRNKPLWRFLFVILQPKKKINNNKLNFWLKLPLKTLGFWSLLKLVLCWAIHMHTRGQKYGWLRRERPLWRHKQMISGIMCFGSTWFRGAEPAEEVNEEFFHFICYRDLLCENTGGL